MIFTVCISALLNFKYFYVSASFTGSGISLILCKFMMQFINVYAPKHETAGKFWPIVHNLVIFSLVLMHAIAVGIFSLKKLSLASTLVLPLPVLTLLFNEYCRKRFLPIFTAYPAEVCWYSNFITAHHGQGDINPYAFILSSPLRHPFPKCSYDFFCVQCSTQILTWICVFRYW